MSKFDKFFKIRFTVVFWDMKARKRVVRYFDGLSFFDASDFAKSYIDTHDCYVIGIKETHENDSEAWEQ